MIDRSLLRENLRVAPQQPATCLWRTVELGHLLASGFLPEEGRMLDLGCGDGRITELVARHLGARWELVGIDPDPEEVELARGVGLYTSLRVAAGDAVPEPDGSFDVVFSNSVLEHISDVPAVLVETSRLLRPGGVLVFTVPTPTIHRMLGGPGLLGRLATGAGDRAHYLAALDRRVHHVTLWDERRWQAELDAAGLRLERTSSYMTRAEVRRWETLANATAGIVLRLLRTDAAPIEAQRRLGLKRASPPAWVKAGVAVGLAAAVGLPAGADEGDGDRACLLGLARRQVAG